MDGGFPGSLTEVRGSRLRKLDSECEGMFIGLLMGDSWEIWRTGDHHRESRNDPVPFTASPVNPRSHPSGGDSILIPIFNCATWTQTSPIGKRVMQAWRVRMDQSTEEGSDLQYYRGPTSPLQSAGKVQAHFSAPTSGRVFEGQKSFHAVKDSLILHFNSSRIRGLNEARVKFDRAGG